MILLLLMLRGKGTSPEFGVLIPCYEISPCAALKSTWLAQRTICTIPCTMQVSPCTRLNFLVNNPG